MNKDNTLRNEYIGRINEVLNYIENNLDEELPLFEMAKIACFSPFHFHRIFSSMTGETINNYINRKRIEGIASSLMMGSEADLTDLSYKFGFKSPSSFSRSFKKYYGVSPSEFRKKIPSQFSKIGKVRSKNGKEELRFHEYICNIDNYLNWLKMNAKIEVKRMPSFNMVYMDHIGPFEQIGEVYNQLFRWAGPKGLLNDPKFKTITLYHDDPKVTNISKLRQSAGITISKDIEVDGKIGKLELDSDKFAVGRFEIGEKEFSQAWDSMCVWVAENGYKSKDGDYYELYHNDHTQHPEKKFILDICIPVE